MFYAATEPFACGVDLEAKCSYLEAAITATASWTPGTAETLGTRAEWGCSGILVSGTSLEIGQGQANTKIITGIPCVGDHDSEIAASIAKAYNGGGKADWFLPSRKELDALCHEFFKERIGPDYSKDNCVGSGNRNAVSGTINGTQWSFAFGPYWSSSEYDADFAWGQSFNDGYQSGNLKGTKRYVRPVRAF